MTFSSRQISPDKWGIYNDADLIATVSCQQTCETIMANLASGRRDTPSTELNELYKAPKLQKSKLQNKRQSVPFERTKDVSASSKRAKRSTKKSSTKKIKKRGSQDTAKRNTTPNVQVASSKTKQASRTAAKASTQKAVMTGERAETVASETRAAEVRAYEARALGANTASRQAAAAESA